MSERRSRSLGYRDGVSICSRPWPSECPVQNGLHGTCEEREREGKRGERRMGREGEGERGGEAAALPCDWPCSRGPALPDGPSAPASTASRAVVEGYTHGGWRVVASVRSVVVLVSKDGYTIRAGSRADVQRGGFHTRWRVAARCRRAGVLAALRFSVLGRRVSKDSLCSGGRGCPPIPPPQDRDRPCGPSGSTRRARSGSM